MKILRRALWVCGFLAFLVVALVLNAQIDTWRLGPDGTQCVHEYNSPHVDETIAACTRFLESGQGGKAWRAYMFLFRAHHYLDDKRDCDSAIKDLDQASRLEPDHASYYLLRGVAYACKGDHDHAIADYTEAIALNPNWPNFYSNRAASWKAKGDTVREQVDLAAAARAEQRGIFGRIVMLIRYW